MCPVSGATDSWRAADQLVRSDGMRIGVLGSGLMGSKLGTIFARAGHQVVFSYARHRKKLEDLAREAGANASAGTPAEAARDADALLLAVHWSRLDDVLKQAGDLAGKTIVSCSLPMNEDDTALALGHTSSGAEQLAKRLDRGRLACAFNTVPSEVLFAVFEGRRRTERPGLVHYGDDEGAKAVAAQLAHDAGFEPVDAGPLRVARYAEPFALLVAQLAYESKAGPELAYRFVRFS
jgi:predicted dinucleotide-binding enzyme